ncbi:MAG: hypothetical protein LBL38_02720 [Lactobacillales bacterium]|nr:hypothetical protein [Lactobacillales bacterium]
MIREEIDSQEIEFLLSRILPLQPKQERRKIYLTLIARATYKNYIIYLLNWLIVGMLTQRLSYSMIGALTIFFEFLIQFFLLLKTYPKLFAFVRNDFLLFPKEKTILFKKTWPNIFGLALYRMIQPRKKIMPILFGAALIILGIIYCLKDKISGQQDIFLLYYYSLLPSFYLIFVQITTIEESNFFTTAEYTNYYYLRRFQMRNIFIKQLSDVVFRNTFLIVLPYLLPIYIFKPFVLSSLFFALCLITIYSIVQLSMMQKTSTVNCSLEEIREKNSVAIISSLNQIENFLLVESAVIANSVILGLSIKFQWQFLQFFFPVFYFLVIISYTYSKLLTIKYKKLKI